jgi:dTDP-4-amino-4,6-dideoxygalactose transaminase
MWLRSKTVNDLPAILGGTPICEHERWPTWPQWDDAERAALLATLDDGAWWSGDGDGRAQRFADSFGAYQGATHALPFTNGTHTLEAALVACDIGDGDEVIVPGLTFVATATSVLATNATPVIVDIDPDSLNIDIAAAEAAITTRTRALVAVHVAGAACDLDALVALCERRGLHLIEDCAHAHGTFWRGRGVGSFGAFGSFSMQRSKLLTAGEGGVLISSDAALVERAWSYSNCGRVPGKHGYHHPTYGSNLRMTEWQGAVLEAQFERFPEQNQRRNASAIALNAAIAEVPGLRPQARDPRMNTQGNYCYVFHYDSRVFANLELHRFETALAAEGIPLDASYPSLNTLELFRTNNFAPRFRTPPRDYSSVELPRAEHAAASTVWIEHRVLLAQPERVLDIARACERIRTHAAMISG